MILSGHIPSEQLEIIIDVIFNTRFLKYGINTFNYWFVGTKAFK